MSGAVALFFAFYPAKAQHVVSLFFSNFKILVCFIKQFHLVQVTLQINCDFVVQRPHCLVLSIPVHCLSPAKQVVYKLQFSLGQFWHIIDIIIL